MDSVLWYVCTVHICIRKREKDQKRSAKKVKKKKTLSKTFVRTDNLLINFRSIIYIILVLESIASFYIVFLSSFFLTKAINYWILLSFIIIVAYITL